MAKFVRSTMKLAGIVLLLWGVFLFLSISPVLRHVRSVSQLYGKYIVQHEFATIELDINSDGTYAQKVTLIPSLRTDTVSGTWSYDNEDSRFTFDHNFMSVVDGFGRFDPNYAKPRETGVVSLPADRWFFRIYIGSSEGTEYKKVD